MNAKVILREMGDEDRTDGFLLKGLIAMYRATGEKAYRNEALKCLDNGVSNDGIILSIKPEAGLVKKSLYGNALFFAWDETGEERYRLAAGQIRKEITELFERSPMLTGRPIVMPIQSFIIEYDNYFGDKQSYKGVARYFQGLRNSFFHEEKQLYSHWGNQAEKPDSLSLALNGRLLLWLVNTIEPMDSQLYEHYRRLADLFLETVRGLMPYRQKRTGLFSREIENQEDEPDIEGSLMVMYALLKGVRLALLDEEKYLPIADDMRYCMEYIRNTLLCFAGFPGSFGIRLMAEAEIREAGLR